MYASAQTLADLHKSSSLALSRDSFEQIRSSGERQFAQIASEAFLLLQRREAPAEAHAFLDDLEATFKLSPEEYRHLIQLLSLRTEPWIVMNLHLNYIRNGGLDPDLFQNAIQLMLSDDRDELVFQIYSYASARGITQYFSGGAMFNIGVALQKLGKIDEAIEVYAKCLMDPTVQKVSSYNIHYAITKGLTKNGIKFLDIIRQASCAQYKEAPEINEQIIEYEIGDCKTNPALIANAVLSNGLCIIRGGCDSAVVKSLAWYVQQEFLPELPAHFDEWIRQEVDSVFTFDARRIAGDILQTDASIDTQCSVVRGVRAGESHTFTPFHQDTSAFAQTIFNIWVPLTPAGGDYPSMQFIRNRLSKAEQTMEVDSAYNQIEIPEDHVLSRYGDRLYDLTAAPGDCVLFLGTTIHRSSNLSRATKDRYNLEVRWT